MWSVGLCPSRCVFETTHTANSGKGIDSAQAAAVHSAPGSMQQAAAAASALPRNPQPLLAGCQAPITDLEKINAAEQDLATAAEPAKADPGMPKPGMTDSALVPDLLPTAAAAEAGPGARWAAQTDTEESGTARGGESGAGGEAGRGHSGANQQGVSAGAVGREQQGRSRFPWLLTPRRRKGAQVDCPTCRTDGVTPDCCCLFVQLFGLLWL